MKPGIVIVIVIALVATAALATAAFATALLRPPTAWATSAITAEIIQDASDGTINGHYTVAEVRAALAYVESDPALSQYSDIEGVLQDYLASLLAAKPTPTPHPTGQPTTQSPTATASPATGYTGQLDYTGGQPLWLFALGGALVVAGVVLRRRSSSGRA